MTLTAKAETAECRNCRTPKLPNAETAERRNGRDAEATAPRPRGWRAGVFPQVEELREARQEKRPKGEAPTSRLVSLSRR